MRTSLSKLTVVVGVVFLAVGCGGGGGGEGEGGSGGGATGGSGSGGHVGSGGTGGSSTGGNSGTGGSNGGHSGGAGGGSGGEGGLGGAAAGHGGGSGGSAGGAAGASAGAGGSAAGASGNGGASAGASGQAGAMAGASGHAGSAGGAAGSSAAGASGNAGAGGGAAGSSAGASGNAGAGGGAAGSSAAGASGHAGSGAGGAAGAAGTSGVAGSSGGAGGAGGAAGSGSTFVQRIQDGTIATGALVSISNVFVTALKVATNNNVTLVVQEPEGVTTGGYTYPAYAGVQVFITSTEATGLGALGSISPGDCISLAGSTSEFQSATEIVTLTALSKSATASTCGTFPTPLDVPGEAVFGDVATDTDGSMTGDQPGAKAGMYESVLVSFANVSVTSATTTTFRVKPAGSPTLATMLVDSFFYSFTAPAVSTTYTKLTGIYTKFGTTNPNFRIDPRGATDLVQ